MKKISIILFTILAIVGLSTSCDVERQFSDYIPSYPVINLVKTATATIGEETVEGTVDNEKHTVTFVFKDNEDFSNVAVKMNFSKRAILKDGALPEFTADLKKEYTFVVNNQQDDVTYTVHAKAVPVKQVDKSQCSVIVGLKYDADPAKLTTKQTNPKKLFDGIKLAKKGAYGDYTYFGWSMKQDGLTNTAGETVFGNAYTFSVGEPLKLSKLVFYPYYTYGNTDGAIYEIYAFTGKGEPTGEWNDSWTLIGTVNDTEKFEPMKDVKPGSPEDLTSVGTTIEFEYEKVPQAQYYRVKILDNFATYFKEKVSKWWKGRTNFYSVAELDVWKHNIVENQ